MDRLAFIFPGQGSQAVGMGKTLHEGSVEAREVIEAAHDALASEVDLRALLFEGPEDALRLTANTQPAILTVSVAAHAALKARMPYLEPRFVAGHSLGEWSALVAAGAIPLRDAVKAVRRRGELMQEAVPEGQGAMAAVMGLDAGRIKVICDEITKGEGVVSPANYNSPDQTVIAGEKDAVDRAIERLKDAGAKRAVLLPVSAPFHCGLMRPVQEGLARVLSEITISEPKAKVVTNVEAEPTDDPAKIEKLLVEQVVAPVRWVECVEAMKAQGVTHFVELGHGRVLAGLMRRIDRELTVLNLQGPEDLDAVASGLKELG